MSTLMYLHAQFSRGGGRERTPTAPTPRVEGVRGCPAGGFRADRLGGRSGDGGRAWGA